MYRTHAAVKGTVWKLGEAGSKLHVPYSPERICSVITVIAISNRSTVQSLRKADHVPGLHLGGRHCGRACTCIVPFIDQSAGYHGHNADHATKDCASVH